jgi:hypothetical protein
MLLGGFAGFALLLASLGDLRGGFAFGESASAGDWDSDGAGASATDLQGRILLDTLDWLHWGWRWEWPFREFCRLR